MSVARSFRSVRRSTRGATARCSQTTSITLRTVVLTLLDLPSLMSPALLFINWMIAQAWYQWYL